LISHFSTFSKVAVLAVILALGGCASSDKQAQIDAAADNKKLLETKQTTQTETPDPLEGVNRVVWDFNYDVLDKFLLKPLTQGYIAITPKFIRTGLLNASENLEEPANTINNLLQGKPSDSAASLGRFAINSTVGLLGFFDVAKQMGLSRKEEDFGQVLGVWGIGTGPYLMLPALGPSDVRSFTGRIVDNVYWPLSVLESQYVIASNVVGVLETRAILLEQEAQLERSLDPYLFVRDAYFQRLAFEVSDGKVPMKSQEEVEKESDDFAEFEGLLDDL
jgi:phospholipid-binding lipoprotein MlaA